MLQLKMRSVKLWESLERMVVSRSSFRGIRSRCCTDIPTSSPKRDSSARRLCVYSCDTPSQSRNTQLRFSTSFLVERNPNKKKKKPNFDPDVQNCITLQFCHNEYDLILEPDDLFFIHSRFDVDHIKEKAMEEYDTSEGLEYLEDQTWKPLRDLKDILKYRGGKKPLKLRVPEYYDDTPLPEGYVDDPAEQNDTQEDQGYMGDMIKGLVSALKLSGYSRSDVKQNTMRNSNGEIATVDWILQRAEEDRKLKSMLLGNAGALEHLVEYLHYDFVWKRFEKQ